MYLITPFMLAGLVVLGVVPRLVLRKGQGHRKQLAAVLESALPLLLQILFIAYPYAHLQRPRCARRAWW